MASCDTDAAGPGGARTIAKLSPEVVDEAKALLTPLSDKKAEWAKLPLDEKYAILSELVTYITAWGMPTELAKAQILARNVEPTVRDGRAMCGVYATAIGVIGTMYLRNLQKGIKGEAPPVIDMKEKFGVELNRKHTHDSSSSSATGGDSEEGTTTTVRLKAVDTTKGALNVGVVLVCEDDKEEEGEQQALTSPPLPYTHQGEVLVLLGAGNQVMLNILDVMEHMFTEGRVCVLKMHDNFVSAIPALEYMMTPLIQRGYLRIIQADLKLTQALIYSDLTDVVHITGGYNTHEAIVWGATPEERAQNKKKHTPILKAQMVSELGAVTPFIVLPGDEAAGTKEWTQKMIETHAYYVIFSLAENGSCNCLAAKVLVLPAEYPELTDAFLAEVKKQVAVRPIEPTWYPGTEARYNRWMEAMKANGAKIEVFSDGPKKDVIPPEGVIPKSLPFALADLGTLESLEQLEKLKDLSWTQEEPFAPVLAVIRLPGATLDSYMSTAFKFADQKLWGNLSCSISCPPSAKTLAVQKIVDGDLRYGSYMMNGSTLESFQPSGYWGGVKTNTLEDVQSGVGNVLNGRMVKKPRFSIVMRDFTGAPTPEVAIRPFFANLISKLVRFLLP